ncbi:hypothetical protein [Dictyobacter kobayashii]|uniref:Uncharacterized protein n=1 Tax=Dictyobacter kobayashii TaxID=2014872 RepID=A0A402AIR8_9CHLR|nr:hypothetical protein [Dictyobacter kobayashii]GCE18950.1 hypothetical protein KDK_27500 [Dictyobacter kobayashii]
MSLVTIQNMIVHIAGSQEGSQLVPNIPMSNPYFIRGYEISLHSKEHREDTEFSDADIIELLRDLVEQVEDNKEPGSIEYYAGSICGLIVARCL